MIKLIFTYLSQCFNADVTKLLPCSLHFQDELDQISVVWNRHRIRGSRDCLQPCGRPDILYQNPLLYHTDDFLQLVLANEIEMCMAQCKLRSSIPCDVAVFEMCCAIMADDRLNVPVTFNDAINTYLLLRRRIRDIL
jgi:hypothetical protein